MERKTKLQAEENKQEIIITREFDLPVSLLFRAYEEAEIVEQWMNTKVLKLENKEHGGWRFETSMPDGTVAFQAHGVIHEFVKDIRITRTFEMSNTSFGPQLEFLQFEKIDNNKSKLIMHIVYRSVEVRDEVLKLPFAWGINMAHDKLQEIAEQLN